MKRTILVLGLLSVLCFQLQAVKSYPVYQPASGSVRPLWQQSPQHATSTEYRNSGGLGSSISYASSSSTHNPIMTSSHQSYSYGGSGLHSTLHSVGATSPILITPLTGGMQITNFTDTKFTPPSTGDEEEPDPTKIETPIGNGMIFVLILLLLYCLIVGVRRSIDGCNHECLYRLGLLRADSIRTQQKT